MLIRRIIFSSRRWWRFGRRWWWRWIGWSDIWAMTSWKPTKETNRTLNGNGSVGFSFKSGRLLKDHFKKMINLEVRGSRFASRQNLWQQLLWKKLHDARRLRVELLIQILRVAEAFSGTKIFLSAVKREDGGSVTRLLPGKMCRTIFLISKLNYDFRIVNFLY